jgi:hypothetical protein
MFIGALRVKNESRWIERVIRAMQPLCEVVHVLDDSSTDGTQEICEGTDGVVLHRSPFRDLNESRDKQALLELVIASLPSSDLRGAESPHIILAFDGDEVLMDGGQNVILEVTARGGQCWTVPIRYLWDNEKQWRTDGVYGKFLRPSIFRLTDRAVRYQSTPFGNGANFHCSSVPQGFLHCALYCNAPLLHYGYMHREDRLRKFEWYNRIDGGNVGEDGYRHMLVGDTYPDDSRFRWGGPLQLQPL